MRLKLKRKRYTRGGWRKCSRISVVIVCRRCGGKPLRRGKGRARALWRDKRGSLTVEALLILPAVLLLLALFFRWGLMLHEEITAEAGYGEGPAAEGQGADPLAVIGFLRGGPPARRIRDADLLIDLGYSIKERLPSWF